MIISWNTAHIIMHGWQNRNRLTRDINAAENLGSFGNTRKPRMKRIWINMLKMKHDMIFVRTNTAAFVYFNGHGTAYHIATCQIFGRWRKSFHEPFAFRIG